MKKKHKELEQLSISDFDQISRFDGRFHITWPDTTKENMWVLFKKINEIIDKVNEE